MTTYAEAVAAAGRELALAYWELANRSPRESAEAAYVSGGPSVEELELRIRRRVFGEQAA